MWPPSTDEKAGSEAVQHRQLTRARLKTPKAAAIAGIIFSILLTIALWLLRLSVPGDAQEMGEWLKTDSQSVALALNLIPISGIGFLWFIGVLRDRLGQEEDRFFATVFLGSGLLLLGMLFVTAAMAGGIVAAFGSQPEQVVDSAAFRFARAAAYTIMNVYTIKIAGVFIISTSTIIVYTGIAPRWMAYLGYGVALFLFFGSLYLEWVFVCFPLWVFLISVHILIENLRRSAARTSER